MTPEVVYIIAGIAILPAIIFAVYAQVKVHSTFAKYSKVQNSRGLTGAALAEDLLRNNNCDVRVEKSHGHLSDHYDPKRKVVALSDGVYGSGSVAALGIAAHEVGHAVQDEQNYAPLKLRQTVIKSTGLVHSFLLPLVIIGLLITPFLSMDSDLLYWILIGAVALYGFSFLISVITLPTEFNASSRAMKMLEESHLPPQDRKGARAVLRAAALTYVAATIISLVYLLRFAALLMMVADKRR